MTDHDATNNAERLAELFRISQHRANVESARDVAKHGWNETEERFESFEEQARPLLTKLVADYLKRDDLPEGLREAFSMMSEPEHMWDFLLQLLGVVGAVLAFFPQAGAIEIRKLIYQLNKDYAFVPLSPADASDAVVRNIASADAMADEAAQAGINRERFDWLVRLTGEPPGPMDMLSLWRRGVIDTDFLDQAIRYSRVKDEYIPAIKALAHSYMSPVDAINVLIKGLATFQEAEDMFVTAGGLRDQFDILYKAYGNAIGPESAMNLWNHGLINEAEVDKVLARSRINPIFYPIAKLQRHKFLSVIQIEAVLRRGGIDPHMAIRWMRDDGYNDEQSSALVEALLGGSTVKAKTDTESMIVQRYELHLLSHPEAVGELAAIGYTAHEADMILATADDKLAHQQTMAVVAKVRAAYEAGHIDRGVAKTDLTKILIPQVAIEAWLTEWDVEASTKTKAFTTAQIGAFAKKGIITYADARARWMREGFNANDALILSADYGDKSALATLQASTGTNPAK